MKTKKIGRNDPCPCGSGKKYKKCCIGKLPSFVMPDELLSKKRFIEEKTGDEVVIEERNNIRADAVTDFGNWFDMSTLPKILHKTSIDCVHLLHELIHLEKFFVDQYSIIACNNRNLHPVLDKFKNIPEDYVAHKIIKDEYALDPIKKSWFRGKDDLTLSDELVAANLVQYHAFCEYCPEYNDKFDLFYIKCKSDKEGAFLMADKAIKSLDSMNCEDRDSYNQCADKIIEIFEPDHHSTSIYLSYFSKDSSGWHWNP